MRKLRDQRSAANSLLAKREQDVLELQRKVLAAEARIEDLTVLLSRQQSALVAKDQEILFLRNQLRDLLKGGALCDP